MTTELANSEIVTAADHVIDEAKVAARRDILFRSIVYLDHSYIVVRFVGEGRYIYFYSGSDEFVSEDEARAIVRVSQVVPL